MPFWRMISSRSSRASLYDRHHAIIHCLHMHPGVWQAMLLCSPSRKSQNLIADPLASVLPVLQSLPADPPKAAREPVPQALQAAPRAHHPCAIAGAGQQIAFLLHQWQERQCPALNCP